MGISVEMVDPSPIKAARAADEAVDLVVLLEENSAKYEPSWPVIPVMRAFLISMLKPHVPTRPQLKRTAKYMLFTLPNGSRMRPVLCSTFLLAGKKTLDGFQHNSKIKKKIRVGDII